MLNTPNSSTFSIDFSRREINLLIDINGKKVTEVMDYQNKPIYYYKEERNKSTYVTSGSNDKTIDPNNVMNIKLSYFLCPVCSNLFSQASNAAFYETN